MPHMSIRRGPLVGFMLLCVTGAGTGISRGAIPGADDPKAYTQHNLYRDRLDFNRRQIVERYKQVGRREPAWDDDHFHHFVTVSQRTYLLVGKRRSTEIFFRYIRRGNHARAEFSVDLNRDLQLLTPCELRIGNGPPWHILQQPAFVAQTLPHLFRDVWRERRKHNHEGLERFAHDEHVFF